MSLNNVVDLTPAAFASGNPKAEENIKAAHSASKRLEDVVAAKADLLRRLVEDEFGGYHGLKAALKKHHLGEGLGIDEAEEAAQEFMAEYERLDMEHDQAGEALVGAMAGR